MPRALSCRLQEQEHSDDGMDGCEAEGPRMPDVGVGMRHEITKCRLKRPPNEDDMDEYKDEYALAAACLLLSVKTRFQVQGVCCCLLYTSPSPRD